MIATELTKQDGIYYEKGEEIPDLGSWEADPNTTNGSFRNYYGNSADKDKLPHYVQTGSSAMCVDTMEIAYFDKSTDEWVWQ